MSKDSTGLTDAELLRQATRLALKLCQRNRIVNALRCRFEHFDATRRAWKRELEAMRADAVARGIELPAIVYKAVGKRKLR